MAHDAYIAACVTRNCVGIWSLESGKLIKTLSNSAHSSIVTHACITSCGKYLVSAESGQLLLWDVEQGKVMQSTPQRDVQQLFLTDEDTKSIVVSKVGVSKAKCVCRAIPSHDVIFEFEYNVKKFKDAVVTCDGLFLVVVSMAAKGGHEVLSVFHAKTGTKMYDMQPKYQNFKDFTHIVAMPHDPHQVALIDSDKGNLWDIKKKSFVRSITRWNGVCSSNGKLGLYAPNRGGLELLELKKGNTSKVLIPRIAEGVHSISTLFTSNDLHVAYYHSGRRSIRVFRVKDGKQIADYKAHAEIKTMVSTKGGLSLVLGAVDGALVSLTIADPLTESSRELLASLPSRQISQSETRRSSVAVAKHANETKLGPAVQVSRMVAKARLAQKSRACLLS